MFSGLFARIIPDSKKDWLSWIANLFLFLLVCFSSSTVMSQGSVSTDTALADTVKVFTMEEYAPLLINTRADSTIKRDSLTPAYIVMIDSSLRVRKDTALQSVALKPFFAPHALKTGKFKFQTQSWHGNEIAFTVLILGFIFLAAAQYYYGKRLIQILRACINSRFLAQLVRNGDLYNEQISIYLFLIYILSIPLLALQVNKYYIGFDIPGGPMGMVYTYLIFLGVYALLYGIKILAIRFSGVIFKTYTSSQEYILILFVFNLLEGLVILFFLVGIIFSGSFLLLQVCILALACIYAYRLIREFFLGLTESKYSIFYLLLFFSTIEVLPTIILLKLIMNFFPA